MLSLPRIRSRFRTIKVSASYQRRTRAQQNHHREQERQFHEADASKSAVQCQRTVETWAFAGFAIARARSCVKVACSVRGYGSRTYEPRQGRNAATVV